MERRGIAAKRDNTNDRMESIFPIKDTSSDKRTRDTSTEHLHATGGNVDNIPRNNVGIRFYIHATRANINHILRRRT